MKSPLFLPGYDAAILDHIRKGDEEVLIMLYQSNRRAIVNLVMRNHGTADDAQDVLQESIVVLWERVRAARFEYAAKLSTFVYATAKNLWSQRLRRMGKEISRDLDPDENESPAPSPLDMMIDSEQATRVSEALARLGEPCRKLLLLFYWEELTMEKIAQQLGFANAATAKAKKYQCKKALESLLKRT